MKTPDHITLAKVIAVEMLPKVQGYVPSHRILNHLRAKLDGINKKYGTNFKTLSSSDIRDMMNYIRRNNLLKGYEICASSKGYFISQYRCEIEAYTQSFRRRIGSMIEAVEAMESRLHLYDMKPIPVVHQKPIEGDLFENIN